MKVVILLFHYGANANRETANGKRQKRFIFTIFKSKGIGMPDNSLDFDNKFLYE